MKDNRYKLSFCIEIGGTNLDSNNAVKYIEDAKDILEKEFGCTKFEFQFRDDGGGHYQGGKLTGYR